MAIALKLTDVLLILKGQALLKHSCEIRDIISVSEKTAQSL